MTKTASVLGAWNIHRYSIPCDTKQLFITYPVSQGPAFFSTFYCFGAVDQYSNIDDNATTDTNPQLYSSDTLYKTIVYNTTGFVQFLWKTSNNYNGTECATFDHVVYDAKSDFDQFYVQPSDRKETGKLSDGGKSGTVSWKKTGNPQDNYTLYWAPTQTAPEGQSFATACSVRQWMNPFTDDQGTVKDNGDNTFTASVKNLDVKIPFTLVVVADRGSNSIAGVYDRIALNAKSDASAMLPSAVLAVVAILAMLCLRGSGDVR